MVWYGMVEVCEGAPVAVSKNTYREARVLTFTPSQSPLFDESTIKFNQFKIMKFMIFLESIKNVRR